MDVALTLDARGRALDAFFFEKSESEKENKNAYHRYVPNEMRLDYCILKIRVKCFYLKYTIFVAPIFTKSICKIACINIASK